MRVEIIGSCDYSSKSFPELPFRPQLKEKQCSLREYGRRRKLLEKNHYAHNFPYRVTEDLTRMRNDIALDGSFLHEGDELVVIDGQVIVTSSSAFVVKKSVVIFF